MSGDFTSFLSNLRLRRIGETPATPVQPELGELDPLPDFLEDGPAMEEYQAHLRTGSPNPEQFHPGPVKGILATLAGALTGFGENSALAGAAAGRSVIDAPYKNALANYTQKAKGLGDLAASELDEQNRRRLFAQHRESLAERKRAEEERAEDRDLQRKALANRPGRTFKPEALRDRHGVLTGEMIIYGPDGPEKVEVPELKGSRTNAESPTIIGKRAANDVARQKATELKAVFDRLQAKYKDTPIIGNPHVGRGQGWLSELATDAGLINDEDVRNLHELARELSNERLYALSGAQINNKEFERLRRTMADPNKSESAFPTDLARFMRYLEAADQGLISENDVDWTPEDAPAPSSGTGTTTAPGTRKYKVRRVP